MEKEMDEAEESCDIFTDTEFRWIGFFLLVLLVIGVVLYATGNL